MSNNIYRVYVRKNYDHFKYKKVTSNPFVIELADFEQEICENKNLRVFTEIWSEDDEDNRKTVQITRDHRYPKDARYTFRIPFDNIEDTIYCFRIIVKNEANAVVIRSFTQTIQPTPYEVDEEIVKGQVEYDLVQGMLKQLEENVNKLWAFDDQVKEYINSVEINDHIYWYIDAKQQEISDKYAERMDIEIEDKVIKKVKENVDTLVEENKEILKEQKNDLYDSNSSLLTELYLELSSKSNELQYELKTQNRNDFQELKDEQQIEFNSLKNNTEASIDYRLTSGLEEIKEELNGGITDLLTRLDNILGTVILDTKTLAEDVQVIEEDDLDVK